MEHGHGPESSEKACSECDCGFLVWETLLGEVAGREMVTLASGREWVWDRETYVVK